MQPIMARAATLTVAGAIAALVLVACGSPDAAIKPTVTQVTVADAPPTQAPTAVPVPKTVMTESTSSNPTEGTSLDAGALAAKGETLFNQFACASCHSVTGSAMFGPALNGVAGTTVDLADGNSVLADTMYLRESILNPDAKVVNGYPSGVMSASVSAFSGELAKEENIAALVAYIESLQ